MPLLPPGFRHGIDLCRQLPSIQSRVYRVTQPRTEGVHRRESAGTGPVNLKVLLVTGAAFSRFHHGPINACLGRLPILLVVS